MANALFVCLGVCCLLVATEAMKDVKRRVRRGDDFPATSTEVANLAQQVNHQEAEITALKNQLTKLQADLNTSQLEVGFFAWCGASHFTLAAYGTIIFDRTYTNVGNAFDAHSGTFTVPVSGTYAFYLTIRVYADVAFAADITLEGSGRSRAFVQHNNLQATCHLYFHVSKGQRVWAKGASSSNHDLHGSHYTHFSGFLVQAD